MPEAAVMVIPAENRYRWSTKKAYFNQEGLKPYQAYSTWQFSQKKLLRFFTPVWRFIEGILHLGQVRFVCINQCFLS
jgi:hypothetical protein